MLTGLRARKAHGCRVLLEDGREYVDWECGLHGAIFGYAPDWWLDAITVGAMNGPISSIAHRDERIVAEMLAQFYPDIEAVRFFLNGSDPCAAAVKLARAITGRDKLLVYGYHGTSSAYAAPPTPFDTDDNRLGTLQAERDAYVSLDWLGDYQSLDDVAAVVVECPPVDGGWDAARSWLAQLATDAENAGALFVLDEVVTGFRYAPGGAAEYYKLLGRVDLYCFGKTLGNGYPVAALAGREDVLGWLAEKPGGGGKVHWSNTFNGEPIGLAVAKATLQHLLDDRPWDNLMHLGRRLKKQWNEDAWVPYKLEGHPTRPVIEGADESFVDLRRHLFQHGHIIVDHPWYITTAMTRSDIDDLVKKAMPWVRE